MKKSDFSFDLPEALIAQRPPAVRAGSRLMWVDGKDEQRITSFGDVLDAFSGNEVLVLNDTRVVPARLNGKKETGGAVEVFFVERLTGKRFVAMLRGKKLAPGKRIILPNAEVEIIASRDGGLFECELRSELDLWGWLEETGTVPLPPYIKRSPEASDAERYQTVYADKPGAVAAPTAGLHFTNEILASLQQKGVQIATVTLHVGLGTFFPVRVENLDDHNMHAETFSVPPETRELLAGERPIVAVGTTVVRALESYALDPNAQRTKLFIRPGYSFRAVDGLITNFHLPESTLLMMICAFLGTDVTLSAYRRAVEEEMRFFSYGDAMVLRRPGGKWI